MTNQVNNQTATQFTEGKLNVVIQGDIMTVEEILFPTNTFQIVETAPIGYEVWNIGSHMPKDYIPYAQVDSERRVNTKTLKAVKVK